MGGYLQCTHFPSWMMIVTVVGHSRAGIVMYRLSINVLYQHNLYGAIQYYIEDITCLREDMNFIFECSTRYLTSERSGRVGYRIEHE